MHEHHPSHRVLFVTATHSGEPTRIDWECRQCGTVTLLEVTEPTEVCPAQLVEMHISMHQQRN